MADITAAGSFLTTQGGIAIGAGIAMGLSALAAGWSQGSMGAALMGAVAERPELESKVIIWMALPEILALLGFVIGFLLIQLIKV